VAAATPVPFKLTVCGLPVALSVKASVAMRDPIAVGAKLTLRVHLAPAATLEPQVFVCEKSLGSAPPIAMLEMLSEALPVFVSVTVCTGAVAAMFSWPNARFAEERLIVVAGVIPVPLKLTVCGLPFALSTTAREALLEPAAEGVNVTMSVQLPPACGNDKVNAIAARVRKGMDCGSFMAPPSTKQLAVRYVGGSYTEDETCGFRGAFDTLW